MDTHLTEHDFKQKSDQLDQIEEDAINMPRSAFIALYGMKNIEVWRRFNDPDYVDL
jgi:hypothetical protein